MPVTFTDRVPLPSLRVYSAVSVMLLSMSIYYAVNVTSDPEWKQNATQTVSVNNDLSSAKAGEPPLLPIPLAEQTILKNDTRTLGRQLADAASFMIQEPICIWTLINMAYCCLFVIGRSIQRVVFGELRVSERQHIKDKFWNFVFYKFIFVFGVINVQYMDEVVLWGAWFSALGFLHIIAQLCKDRFEYLSFSASSGGWAGARLAALLGGVLAIAAVMMMMCGAVALFGGGLNIFAFMAAECVLLSIRTMHVLFRYVLHVVESRGAVEGLQMPPQASTPSLPAPAAAARDRRAPLAHYAELAFELAALAVDLMHHIHMLMWSNIFLSMASLVICMQLRYLFHEIQRRVKKHRNYLWVLNHMEKNYPMATADELTENSDNCAICWEKMETARKLPCAHLFHNSCLSSWLQQDTSCPTCRLGLSLWPPASTADAASAAHSVGHTNPRHPNHFFHFDGSRYVSWLPSFSVEVTHMMRGDPQTTNSQMDAMARQVQQLFPHLPISVIVQDLQSTLSVEGTVDNILDGRLVLPSRFVTLENGMEGVPSGVVTAVSSLPVLPGVSVLPIPGILHLPQSLTPPSAPTPSSQVFLQHSLSMLASQFNQQRAAAESWNADLDVPHVESDDHTPAGSRFSKCSHERERILQKKKEQLLNSARQKYMEKHSISIVKPTENVDKEPSSENDNSGQASTANP